MTSVSGQQKQRPEVKKISLVREIAFEEQKTYLEVPFFVEQGINIEMIKVSYSYAPDDRTVIDLGLKSPERIIGWSGGARSHFFVGLDKATPGYLAGPFVDGTWAVLLGAYKVPEEGCVVNLDIELIYKGDRWLKGDLHMHSIHSDGGYTLPQVFDLCRQKGLQFIALTDHNTASQNKAALMSDDELVVIPGVELTSYYGHANLFGQLDALEDFRVTTPDQAAAQLGQASAKGALVSLNHPMDDYCPWELGFEVPFDAIEVWNGPWRPSNEAAVAWWHEQLCLGKRIVAIGGSDTHRPDRYVEHGRPTNYILASSDSAEGVLQGLRSGHVILSQDVDFTVLFLSSGNAQVGDFLEIADDSISMTLKVVQAREDRVTIWSDQGIEATWTVSGDAEIHFIGTSDRIFYRAESKRYLLEMDMEIMTCLTNPLYVGKRAGSAL